MSKNYLNKTFAANMAQPKSHRRNMNHLFSAPVNFGDTNRDDSKSYGYPDYITFEHMYNLHKRNGFAKAMINKVVNRCFIENPTIIDGDADTRGKTPTAFEKAVDELNKKFKLFNVIKEAEKYARVGNYATIVPVFKERSKTELTDEIGRVSGLVSINPFYQVECKGSTDYVSDYFDKDWNKPKYYELNTAALSDRRTTNAEQINIHRSRVFVVTNAVGAQIEGTPVLEAPFNALFDANKIRGSSAEGSRKNAKQRTVMSADDPKAIQAMGAKKEEIDQSIDDFENGINNYLKLGGSKVYTLQSNLADPTGAFNIALQEAFASDEVPMTEMIGFMTGERSSEENSKGLNKYLKSKQTNEFGPRMISIYEWFVDLGLLPAPSNGSINVVWPDISEPSKSEKLANSKSMIEDNKTAYDAREEAPWTTEEIREAGGADKDKPATQYELEMPKDELTLDDVTDEDTPD